MTISLKDRGERRGGGGEKRREGGRQEEGLIHYFKNTLWQKKIF